MPVIKPSCVRDLKLRVNLADVISRVVTLRKAGGSRLKGLCPFHNEKTPSFNVDSDKGFYKCFGCGKAGDAITFVRETEQLSFTEAVETLGQRYGVPIEYEEGSGPSREERSLRQELFDLHEQAAVHFHDAFKAAGPAGDFMRAYWVNERRFTPDLADEFKIGAAGSDGSALGAAILKKRYSEDALRQCGLFFIRDDAMITAGALRPRFRGRLMIPIRDHQGRVVAFTARQTSLTPDDDPAKEAKYVNSPETPIFTKGHLLFNLDRARTAVGEGRPFVMVEGQLDALRCWSVGLKTAVAPQGTSITDGQLALLRRYHTELECFFDSDSAGQKAALQDASHGAQGQHRGALSHAGGRREDRSRPALPRKGDLRLRGDPRVGALRDGVRVPRLPPLACNRVLGAALARGPGGPRDHFGGGKRGFARFVHLRGGRRASASGIGAPERPEPAARPAPGSRAPGARGAAPAQLRRGAARA